MRPKHVTILILAFLVILIASYFGASIHNSKTNVFIEHLNQMDNINHYNVELIPSLNFRAGIITLPLLLIILVIEIIIFTKSDNRKIKNIAIGAMVATLIVIFFGVLTITYPNDFDFSKWGYVWITMGIVIFASNALSIFVKPSDQKV